MTKLAGLAERKRRTDEALEAAQDERRRATEAAIERGQSLRLATRVREAIEVGIMVAPDDEVLRLSALTTARAARDELRRAAEHQSRHLTDWDAALRLDSAFENLERAERRAARFGGSTGVYRRNGGPSMFVDLWRSSGPIPNPDALRRLEGERSSREFRTGLDMTSSFVPPTFDLSQWSDVPRSGRVLTSIVPTKPLGKGSTLSIPKLTASAVVGTATDNTDPSQGTFTDEFDVSNIAWVAGQLPVSLQWFQQGWGATDDGPAEEALIAAYDEALETAAFQGPGTAANLLGLLNISGNTAVTYTDTSPTADAMLTKIGELITQVANARKLLPSALLMRPARWAFLATGTDAQSRPFLTINGPVDAKRVSGSDPVGSIFGVATYATAGIPANLGSGTNQDAIVAARVEDLRLYLTEPSYSTYVDTNGETDALSVILSLSGSAAWLPDRRPAGVGILTGSGLIVQPGF